MFGYDTDPNPDVTENECLIPESQSRVSQRLYGNSRRNERDVGARTRTRSRRVLESSLDERAALAVEAAAAWMSASSSKEREGGR